MKLSVKVFLSFLMLIMMLSVKAQSNNCQTTIVDTLKYVENIKTTVLDGLGMNSINAGGSYGYAGYGQRFEAPDSVILNGFCFYGFVYSGIADTVVCRLYTADISGMPSIQLDSVIVTVPLMIGYSGPLNDNSIQVCAVFNTFHIIEGDYIVTVENFSNSDMYITRNSDGDGAAEDLSLTYYRGISDPSFDSWYKTYPFGSGWNFDLVFEPLIEYTIDSEISILDDTLCIGDTLNVSALISSFDDSVFYHRMYNTDYSIYSGYTVSNNYDYGDLMSDSTGVHVHC